MFKPNSKEMKYSKGQSGNPAGRPQGKPNKTTQELRNIIKGILSDELERLPAILQGMNDKDRADFTIKLLAYILPKPETDQEGAIKQEPVNIVFTDFQLNEVLESIKPQEYKA
jgi:hypothetical protein